MKRVCRILAMAALLSALCACAPGQDDGKAGESVTDAVDTVPEGPLPRDVIPEACRLRLEILPEAPVFSGRVEIAISVTQAIDRMWLHGRDLDVSAAEIVLSTGERIPGTYRQMHVDGVSLLEFPREVPPGQARLEIDYTGRFADDLTGLFRTEAEGTAYVFSDFQPIQARRAFPGFDEPAFKIPYEVELVTRREHVALSNARQIGEDLLEGGLKRVRFAPTPPLPAYLVAVAVGPLDVVETEPVPVSAWRQEPIRLRGIAARGKGDRLGYALANTAVMVEALESYFEMAYPYDKLDLVAVPNYPVAMENAGLIFYSEYLLLMDESPSMDQQQAFGDTHAHELAHQWFGNLVTMAWWDDLWLNEAFASWMAGKVVAEWRPDMHHQREQLAWVFGAMDEDSLASARSVREPVQDAAGMFAAFDNMTYVKGAAVLGMIENYMGREEFRLGIRDHLQRFAHGNADVFDLIESLEGVVDEDLKLADVFGSFLFSAGVPMVSATVDCAGDQPRVRLSQSRYLPLGSGAEPVEWNIPVCMNWGGGDVEAPTGRCVLLETADEEVPLGTGCPGWLMPNRGAAGYYRWSVTPTDVAPVHKFGEVLDDLERMSVADSLSAAVHTGQLGMDAYLRLLPHLVSALERSVSMAPAPELRRLTDFVIEPDQLAAARAYFGALYGRRLEFLDRPGGAEAAPEATRFRSQLIRFLAEEVRDTSWRARLRDQAVALTEPSASPDDEALDPDLRGAALAVGVQELGTDFFDLLVGLLRSETPVAFRRDLVRAIGKAEDPLLVAKSRNLMLDEAIRPDELPSLLARLTERPRVEGTWDWFTGNRSALMDRFPGSLRNYLPLYFGALCDQRQASELQKLFLRYEESVPGIGLAVRQITETMEICHAYRVAHQDEARKFFDALGRQEAP